jgi:hypothetical protein
MFRSTFTQFSNRKISETLLDFAEPLLECLGERPSPDVVEASLKIAWVVWNASVIEQTTGDSTLLAELRHRVGEESIPRSLSEELIERKRSTPRFAADHRLMGELKMVKRSGEWALQLEARTPPKKRNSRP